MGGFGKKLNQDLAKVAGGVAEVITGIEAVGKGLEKGLRKGSAKKRIKEAIKEGKEEIFNNAKDALDDAQNLKNLFLFLISIKNL